MGERVRGWGAREARKEDVIDIFTKYKQGWSSAT